MFNRQLSFLLSLAMGQAAWGQNLTYPGCTGASATNFQQETLVRRVAGSGGVVDNTGGRGLWEPTKLAVGTDAQGNIEVYFTELGGSFKVYKHASKTVTRLIKLDVDTVWSSGDEMGLMGVGLDPKFNQNNRVYLFYSPRGTPYWRISRFTLNAARTSAANEQMIFQFNVQKVRCCHTGGGIQFDDLGDLWVSVGNNEGRGQKGINENDSVNSGEGGAASTMSIRGSVIRIRPRETPNAQGKLYDIPAGNFGDYWGGRFAAQGNATLAAQYRDPNKVMPELFVKGMRNPYGIAVDRVRRWVAVGDVGPDGSDPSGSSMGEDHDLYLNPGFGGWPYWAGNNRVNAGNKNPSTPMNTSRWNKGVQQLPPAHTPLWEARNSASFAGIWYRYDKNLNSPVKLPALFHNHVIWGNWSSGSFYAAKINDNGTMAASSTSSVFGSMSKNGPTDIQLGPDGAVYVVNYAGFFGGDNNTRIDRYLYRGQQCNVDVPYEKAGCKDKDPTVTLHVPDACNIGTPVKGYVAKGPNTWGKLSANLGGNIRTLEIPEGIRKVDIYDLKGKLAHTYRNDGKARTLHLPAEFPQGLYQVLLSK